ncbi:DUF4184 family protein [Paenibacillus sp. HB172176]|uniref:DUF4184 family protein n=1 Tax=Paenibacillus sp. HB172176 TaxID=2493690 RepID=UPI00143A0997|nr:DUF4184 family protein [Paenibacillus sp. HB172176]
MPFTFAHPAFAFPLKWINRKYVSLTGLTLGSMAPDMEYFLHFEPYRSIGHTLPGFFRQAIPLSIIFAIVFHLIVKKSLALHLPSAFHLNHRAYHMLGEWRMNSVASWLIFLISLFIGFVSHLTVDSFTHSSGFFAMHFPSLKFTMIMDRPLYKLLQYGFSLLGLGFIAMTILYYLFRSNSDGAGVPEIPASQKLLFWSCTFVIAIGATWIKLETRGGFPNLSVMFVAPFSGFCVGLVFSSLVDKLGRWMNRT